MSGVLGRVLDEDGRQSWAAIEVSGETIRGVHPVVPTDGTHSTDSSAGFVRLPKDCMVVPGFVDLHCHGGFGVDFPTSNVADARKAASRIHQGGTTTLLASLVTADRTALLAGTERLAGLAESGDIACIHLEGPFLSQARCGAQNPDWLIDPNMSLTRELVRTARGALRTMTFAPELPSTNELVDVLASLGVVPSVGHTASSPEVAGQALARAHHELSRHHHTAGRVPTVTHLFNGMEPMHHRSPGAVSARGTCRQGNRGAHRR